MIYLDIFLISFIMVAVLDISGFYDEMYLIVKKWLTGGKLKNDVNYIKPWSCSLCMTHHIAFIYMLIAGAFSLHLWAYILLVSLMTPVIKEVVIFIREFLVKVLIELENYFGI